MTFWFDDGDTLLSDFGLSVAHDDGTVVRGILDEEDVLIDDGTGQVHGRETILTVETGALPALAIGDVLVYDGTTNYTVRRFDVIDDGVLTRIVVVK